MNRKSMLEVTSIIIIIYGLFLLYAPIGVLHKWALPILLVGVVLFAIISPRKQLVERISMGMIVFGLVSLCQPLFMILFSAGFHILLSGTVAFIVIGKRG